MTAVLYTACLCRSDCDDRHSMSADGVRRCTRLSAAWTPAGPRCQPCLDHAAATHHALAALERQGEMF